MAESVHSQYWLLVVRFPNTSGRVKMLACRSVTVANELPMTSAPCTERSAHSRAGFDFRIPWLPSFVLVAPRTVQQPGRHTVRMEQVCS